MKKIEIEVEYEIGDVVYLATDESQDAHIVTGYCVRKTTVIYHISYNGKEFTVFDFEISASKNQLKQLGIE